MWPADELQEFSEDDIAVYCMNPAQLNTALHDISHPVDVSEGWERWHPYARPTSASKMDTYAPICVVAPHASPRIRAQSGTFTLHGSNVQALDYYNVVRELLHKILISKDRADHIRAQLRLLGMTTSYIYPDLDGVAKEITISERLRFQAERREFLSGIEPALTDRQPKTSRKRAGNDKSKR